MILDECTDVYRLEQVIIYVRYSKQGKVFTKSLYFSCKFSNRQFMEFAIFMLDVVNSLSIFNKASQDRKIYCTSVNNSLQKFLLKLVESYNNPSCGENWKKREALLVSLLRVLY